MHTYAYIQVKEEKKNVIFSSQIHVSSLRCLSYLLVMDYINLIYGFTRGHANLLYSLK